MKNDTSRNGRAGSPESESEAEEEVSFFHKVRSDVFLRKVEAVLREGVLKNIVSEMKLPKEIISHLISQIDETKQATLKMVTREVRQFLENTNLADEMARLLSQLSFEVSTKVRFVRNDPPSTPSSRKRKASRISEKFSALRQGSDESQDAVKKKEQDDVDS